MKSLPASNRGIKWSAGFTLTELLLVMAISAVLFAITVPIAIDFYRRQQLSDATETLLDALRRSRVRAVSALDDRPHGVKIMAASSSIILFEGWSYAARVQSQDEIILFPASVSINGTSTEVTFSKLYGTSTLNEIWGVTNGSATASVGINFQGTVEVQ